MDKSEAAAIRYVIKICYKKMKQAVKLLLNFLKNSHFNSKVPSVCEYFLLYFICLYSNSSLFYDILYYYTLFYIICQIIFSYTQFSPIIKNNDYLNPLFLNFRCFKLITKCLATALICCNYGMQFLRYMLDFFYMARTT